MGSEFATAYSSSHGEMLHIGTPKVILSHDSPIVDGARRCLPCSVLDSHCTRSLLHIELTKSAIPVVSERSFCALCYHAL